MVGQSVRISLALQLDTIDHIPRVRGQPPHSIHIEVLYHNTPTLDFELQLQATPAPAPAKLLYLAHQPQSTAERQTPNAEEGSELEP